MKKGTKISNRRSYFGKDNPNYRHGKARCQNCNIEVSDMHNKLCRKCYLSNKEINITKEKLIELYIDKKLSAYKIAKIFKCSSGCIFDKLHKYNIKTRIKTDGYSGEGNPNYKGIIRKCLDCDKTIDHYTKTTRCWNCCIKYNTRENHYNWQGGKSFEPYGLEFNKDLKEVIRNRDRRKCQICEKTELENGRKLDIHHIDYNKRNNNPNNLITLCCSCHTKTNHNREHWQNYFLYL